jgi:hypothetical protein
MQFDLETFPDHRRQLSFGAGVVTKGQQVLTQRGTQLLPLREWPFEIVANEPAFRTLASRGIRVTSRPRCPDSNISFWFRRRTSIAIVLLTKKSGDVLPVGSYTTAPKPRFWRYSFVTFSESSIELGVYLILSVPHGGLAAAKLMMV